MSKFFGQELVGIEHGRRQRHRSAKKAFVAALTLVGLVTVSAPAYAEDAATVSSVGFTGGTGTVTLAGTVWARSSGALTLTVTTTNALCVDVSGAFTGHQTSAAAKSTWTFAFTAPGGNGPQTVTATAYPGVDPTTGACTGLPGSSDASYSLDNTGPVLSSSKNPAANAAGWNNTNVALSWTATDTGVGVAAAQPFTTQNFSAEAVSNVSQSGQRDRLNNLGASGSATVRVDKTAPGITVTTVKNPDNTTQVTFACSDLVSRVASCAVDGVSPQTSTVTVTGPITVSGTATDNAGNTNTTSVYVPANDQTPPTITHTVSPEPNAAGWHNQDATVTFVCADGESGILVCRADDHPETDTVVVSDEGTTSILGTAMDNALNSAADQADINLDKSLPTIGGAADPAANSHGWYNDDVTVTFTCADEVSGIAGCSGDSVLSNEGAGQTVSGDALDVADNHAGTVFGPVNIDKTKPTLTGVLPDANGAGWFNGDVTVTWVGDDGLSGLDAATQPAPSVITGEGSALGSGPVTISDLAGNSSDPASVTGVKIDRTAPVLSGGPTTAPNAAGWYRDNVTIDFTCTDPLSGVATCPTSKVISGDGAGQGLTSDPATDLAGNVTAGKAVAGINIDGSAPSTSADNQCTRTNGWCTGATANVVLTASDQAGLSGVKEIRYRIGSGAEKVANGSSTTVAVPLDGSGEATVSYWAVDVAGNAEPTNSVSLHYDNIAPTVTHTLTPVPSADGWNNSTVTLHFSATDNDQGSGVDPSTVTPDLTVSNETAGLLVIGSATDTAGNIGTDPVTVRLDKTKPVISAAITSGTLGNNGWYVGPVTVTFTCSDALAGVATCPDPAVLTANGLNSASGTVTDRAGNTASTSLGGIKIDQEKPTLTPAGVNVQGQTYLLGAVPAATCSASDSVSGLVSCVVTVTPSATGVGTFTYSAKATDNAGNTTTVTGSYSVIYRFEGFRQPIDDPAYNPGATTSIFKASSSVPVKFQLKRADGSLVEAATLPIWVTPVKGSPTSGPVDESVYNVPSDSGSTYRVEAGGYAYNWKSNGGAGYYWRIGVKLDDGRSYYVSVGLK